MKPTETVQVPFADLPNPRLWGISSDGFKCCGTAPVELAASINPATDLAVGFTMEWSPLGEFRWRRKEAPGLVGISCRGINTAGAIVGFGVTKRLGPPKQRRPGLKDYYGRHVYWPAYGNPIVFDFANADYSGTDSPKGSGNVLFGINDNGVVVGQYALPGDKTVGFFASINDLLNDPTAINPNTLTLLSFPIKKRTHLRVQPRGVNRRGIIVGSVPKHYFGFITLDGGLTFSRIQVQDAQTTDVTGINDYGEIVGTYTGSDGGMRGFRWAVDDNGHTVDNPSVVNFVAPGFYSLPLPNSITTLNGIDNFGTVVGQFSPDGNAKPEGSIPFFQRGGI